MSLNLKVIIVALFFIILSVFMVLDEANKTYYFKEFDITEDLIQKSFKDSEPDNVILTGIVDKDTSDEYWAILTVDTIIEDTTIIYTGRKHYWIFIPEHGELIEQPSLQQVNAFLNTKKLDKVNLSIPKNYAKYCRIDCERL